MVGPRKTGKFAALCLSLLMLAVFASACATSDGESQTGETQTTFQRILDEKVMTFGFANEPPYTIAEMGNVTGTDPEILKAIMQARGVETFNGVLVEFPGLIPGLLAERFDAIAAGLFVRPARCEQVAFANPYLLVREGLVVRQGNPLNIHSISDIAANPDIRIAVVFGGVQHEYLEIGGVDPDQIARFQSVPDTLAALATDRVDAVMFSVPILASHMAARNDTDLEYADPFESPVDADGNPIVSYVAVAFREEDSDLRDAYNQGLAELRASGELTTIVESFGFTSADIPPADLTIEEICAGS